MKIAFIVRKLNVKGGTQRQAVFLARELKKMGHQVKFYTFIYSAEDCYENLLKEFKIVSLDYYPIASNYFVSLFLENRAAKKLAFLIDKDTDILHPHDQVSYRVAYYFKKKVKNIPSVWVMNDLPTKIWSFQRDSQFDPKLKSSFVKRFFYWLVDEYEIKKFIKPQDKIIVLDDRDQKWVKQYFDKQAIVVRSGLDLEEFSYKERQSLLDKKAKILMTGIFFRHRRFEDGIAAVKILKEKNYDVNLSIVGDYHVNEVYYEELIGLIKKSGIEDLVNFAGRVSDEELLNFYQRSDIFLFPNHWQSWGLAVFEAMACGVPAVVSKTAGASEVLTDGENALLVEPFKPEDLAAAVVKLIDNPGFYIKISRQGREFVEKNISWPLMAQKVLEIFKGILKD